jgi:hypothetical protein
MNALLIAQTRTCVVCGKTTTPRPRVVNPSDPRILAITPVMYFKGAGKCLLKNCRKVQICDQCLVKATTNGRLGWLNNNSTALWDALRASLADCYSYMVQTDMDNVEVADRS